MNKYEEMLLLESSDSYKYLKGSCPFCEEAHRKDFFVTEMYGQSMWTSEDTICEPEFCPWLNYLERKGYDTSVYSCDTFGRKVLQKAREGEYV